MNKQDKNMYIILLNINYILINYLKDWHLNLIGFLITTQLLNSS